MQWSVKSRAQNFTVSLPSNWCQGRWFNAAIEGQSLPFLSHQFGCAIATRSEGALTLERNIDLRQTQLLTTPGDLKLSIQGDVWHGPKVGCTLIRAEVMPWLPPELAARSSAQTREFTLRSPMTGKVLRVIVNDGAEVKRGDDLLVVEAMKMENRITAGIDGKIEGLNLIPGVNISSGQILLKIVPTVTP